MKLSIIICGALIGAFGLLPANEARAASDRYLLMWLVDPIEPNHEERTVKPGDVVAEGRLLPLGLATIDSDAVAADGKIAVRGGAQLAMLRAPYPAACRFTYDPAGAFQRIMFGDRGFACLVDADRDGRFESAFTAGNSPLGIPLSYGKIPSKRVAITPIPYRKTPIAEAVDLPRLLFKYSHQDKITGHAYFGVCLGNGTNRREPCFDGYSGVRSDKLPKEIGASGVLAVATAKQGAAVTLTVKNGFDRQPFTAMVYTRLVFY